MSFSKIPNERLRATESGEMDRQREREREREHTTHIHTPGAVEGSNQKSVSHTFWDPPICRKACC